MEIANESAPPLLGRLLDDRYRLDHIIARGGMATVYLANDLRLDRVVAVKVMHRALAEDPDFVARFTREAKAAARVSAPEVVAVHDQGTDPGTGLAYLVMEYLPGTTLRHLLEERGAQPPHRAMALMEPVLIALAAAHAAGLVHRDVKPENVLLGDDGRVKVTDFGLARAVETSNVTQTTGLLIGTVAYLAPEQVESGTADARSDVYAAGVLLWELLTGSPPYAGETPLSVAYRHVHEDVPAPSTLVGGIPAPLDELVVAATRRDPAARPADGAAFLRALRVVMGAPPAAAHPTLMVPRRLPDAEGPALPEPPVRTTTAAAAPVGRRRRRRGPRIVTLVITVLALLALTGGYYLGSYRNTETPSVLGLTLAKATSTLETAGLRVERGKDLFSESVPAGRVLKQDPAPTNEVRRNGIVTVQLSKGPDRRAVPDVLGKDLATARTALVEAGLQVADAPTSRYSASVPVGQVLSSNPKPGTKLRPGAAVALVVSKGPEPVNVPNVTGRKQADATSTLQSLGFRVAIEQVFSDTVDAGRVVGQSP
jgi:serine/threonine-protein kinase